MRNNRIPPKHLTMADAPGIVKKEGAGTEGHPLSSASSPSELVEALDAAIGAVAGMFAVAALTPNVSARTRLDDHYETLIANVEVFREAVPKA